MRADFSKVGLGKAQHVPYNVFDVEVFPPLLGGQQHRFRLGDVKLAGAQESMGEEGK